MIKEFNTQGYCLTQNTDWEIVRAILIKELLTLWEGKIDHLEDLHQVINIKELNDYRLKMINQINESSESIERIINPFWKNIKEITGPDCLRQKRINLVIHMPQDENSIIPMHTDVKTGNSAFEIGLWLPLTECLAENTMSILPFSKWEEAQGDMNRINVQELVPIINKGAEALFFKHFLPHGNSINQTNQTRVSLNIRFKSLFSPENKKTILDYYTPWKISDFSRIAIDQWER